MRDDGCCGHWTETIVEGVATTIPAHKAILTPGDVFTSGTLSLQQSSSKKSSISRELPHRIALGQIREDGHVLRSAWTSKLMGDDTPSTYYPCLRRPRQAGESSPGESATARRRSQAVVGTGDDRAIVVPMAGDDH